MLPPAFREIQQRLAAVDLAEMIPPADRQASSRVLTAEKEELAKVREISATVDSIMQQVAGDAVQNVGQRHTYQNNRSLGNAKVFFGDQSNGPRGPARPGHVFTGNEASGDAKVQYGDRENMPDFFA